MKYFHPSKKYFTSKEFVSKSFYQKTKKYLSDRGLSIYLDDIIYAKFDPSLLWTIERIRIYYNRPVLINNWYAVGGSLNYRGYREKVIKGSSERSQHNNGRALDFNVSGISSDEAYHHILKNYNNDMYQYITAIEDKKKATTWTHFDTRNYNKVKHGLLIVWFWSKQNEWIF